jgi:Lrp/AsnC family transcriptional regulator, leucine-responsive regulatory protein
MIKNSLNMELDDVDKSILRILQENGNLKNVDLAKAVNLSAPATHARVRRLEQEGYVRHYAAIVDREKAGYDLLCFIHVNIQLHQVEQVQTFRDAIREMPEVLECHHITGDADYLLKVVARNRQDLERFVVGRLTPVPGISRIHTSLVFTEVKATTVLPLE